MKSSQKKRKKRSRPGTPSAKPVRSKPKKSRRGRQSTPSKLRSELMAVREQLRDARETIDAIRTGQVDALVVSGKDGHQVYSLTGAEQPYRVYIERMQEGAVTVSGEGLILYCNQRFADMLDQPLGKVIGSNLSPSLSPGSWF